MPRPNLVLIMTDQQRGDCLGIAGHPDLLTPNLDHLAWSGARFTAAYSECPICIPARHTLMTGMSPSATGCVGWAPQQRIAEPEKTLPNLLRLAGYQTAMVGRNMHQYPHSKRYGFETIWDNPYTDIYSRFHQHQRFSRHGLFEEWPHLMGHGLHCNESSARPWHLADEFHQTNYAVTKAIQWLDERDEEAPFFLSVGFIAPHPPLCPPAFFYERYRQMDLTPPAIGEWAERPKNNGLGLATNSSVQVLEGEKMRAALAGYYGLINHVDNQLTLLLDRLQSEENTTILFTSDHGEMLGDHYRFRKSTPYEGAAHIPFLLCGPEIPPDTVCDGVVGLQDVLPTFCELAEVEVPANVTGRSVLGLLRDEAWRPYLHGEHAPSAPMNDGMHYLTDGTWKYIWFGDGTEQLFDVRADQRELHDLCSTNAHQDRLQVWRGRLIEELKTRPEGFSDGHKLIAGRPYRPSLPHAVVDVAQRKCPSKGS